MLKSSIYTLMFTNLCFGGLAGCLTPEGTDPASPELARDSDQDLASVSQSSTKPCGGPGYTVGDFNGDGKSDMIVTTDTGSSWYFSNGNGTWTVPYTRSDLVNVMFTPGDFNGDGKTDLIITTTSGSYWYFSNGDGTWTVPYIRSDLPYHYAEFTPGDFNGDGKTDLIITTTSASYWYFSNGNGSWTVPYIRPDLALQTDLFGPYSIVMFTPGDFNGDGKTDVIITTASGSSWFFSKGDGTWSIPYVRADLYYHDSRPNGHNVEFTPGDFNGDGKSDLVITTPGGSYWYFSNGNGTWTYPYTRADLVLGSVDYDAGDFNGDGKSDLLVEVLDDQLAYWYLSNGNGSWSTPLSMNVNVASDRKYDVWMLGDFNGDGKKDVISEEATGSFWYFSQVLNGQYSVQLSYSRADWGLECIDK